MLEVQLGFPGNHGWHVEKLPKKAMANVTSVSISGQPRATLKGSYASHLHLVHPPGYERYLGDCEQRAADGQREISFDEWAKQCPGRRNSAMTVDL